MLCHFPLSAHPFCFGGEVNLSIATVSAKALASAQSPRKPWRQPLAATAAAAAAAAMCRPWRRPGPSGRCPESQNCWPLQPIGWFYRSFHILSSQHSRQRNQNLDSSKFQVLGPMELHPATISNNLQLTMNSCRIWPLFPTFCKSNLSFFGGNDPSSTTTVYQSGPGIVQMQSAPYDLKFARDDIQSILASCFGSFRIKIWIQCPSDADGQASSRRGTLSILSPLAAILPANMRINVPAQQVNLASHHCLSRRDFDHGIPCGEVGNDTWWISPLSWAIKILGVWSSKYARVYSIQSQDEPR